MIKTKHFYCLSNNKTTQVLGMFFKTNVCWPKYSIRPKLHNTLVVPLFYYSDVRGHIWCSHAVKSRVGVHTIQAVHYVTWVLAGRKCGLQGVHSDDLQRPPNFQERQFLNSVCATLSDCHWLFKRKWVSQRFHPKFKCGSCVRGRGLEICRNLS